MAAPFTLRKIGVPPNSANLTEARRRVFDFFRAASRSLPTVMDIYNLQDVVAPSQLRFAITLTSLILRCFPYSHSDQYQTLESFFVCELVKRLAKNIILAGVKSVTLHDENVVELWDLSSNFVFSEEDVGKNRALASLQKLQELHNAVNVSNFDRQVNQRAAFLFPVSSTAMITCYAKQGNVEAARDLFERVPE
ncbi:unnamed protein product, partial [Brassica oleracea]